MWGGSAQTWFQKLSFYAEPSFSRCARHFFILLISFFENYPYLCIQIEKQKAYDNDDPV